MLQPYLTITTPNLFDFILSISFYLHPSQLPSFMSANSDSADNSEFIHSTAAKTINYGHPSSITHPHQPTSESPRGMQKSPILSWYHISTLPTNSLRKGSALMMQRCVELHRGSHRADTQVFFRDTTEMRLASVDMKKLPKWNANPFQSTAMSCRPSGSSPAQLDALAQALQIGFIYGEMTLDTRTTPLLAVHQGVWSHSALRHMLSELDVTFDVQGTTISILIPSIRMLKVDQGLNIPTGRPSSANRTRQPRARAPKGTATLDGAGGPLKILVSSDRMGSLP
jgi:hypothetical protein